MHVRDGMKEFKGSRMGMPTKGAMVQPSQQHVAPFVKGVEWGGDGHERFKNSPGSSSPFSATLRYIEKKIMCFTNKR